MTPLWSVVICGTTCRWMFVMAPGLDALKRELDRWMSVHYRLQAMMTGDNLQVLEVSSLQMPDASILMSCVLLEAPGWPG